MLHFIDNTDLIKTFKVQLYNIVYTEELNNGIESHFHKNKYKTLMLSHETMTALEELCIEINDLDQLDINSMNLLNIKELKLNSMKSLFSEDTLKITNKCIEKISINKVINITLTNLTNLTKLKIEGICKYSLESISKLINLTDLYLNRRSLNKYLNKNQNEIKLLKDINNLSLNKESENNLNELKLLNDISYYYYLSDDELTEINLTKLSKLINLTIISCFIKINTTGLKNIKYLDLSNNNITDIDLHEQINLKHLNLSKNNLRYIDIKNNSKLKFINLSNNYLTTLILTKSKSMITHLNLNHNKLRCINCINLVSLKYLNLSFNYIEHIDLHRSTNLKILDLSNNRLKFVNLDNLINLNLLDLSSNNLSKNNNILNISKMQKLTFLNLSNNNFTEIYNVKINITEIDSKHVISLSLLFYNENIRLTNIESLNLSNCKINEVLLRYGEHFLNISLSSNKDFNNDLIKNKFTNLESNNIKFNIGNNNFIVKLNFVRNSCIEIIDYTKITKK